MKTLLTLLLFAIQFVTFGQETPSGVIITTPPPVVFQGEKENINDSTVIDFPEIEAEFKGGANGMQEYIAKNVEYPMYAIDRNITGKVFISFIVEKNGRITNVQVERGAHTSLDAEAVRLISEMPKWKPGKKYGKKVRTRVRLPINFTLN